MRRTARIVGKTLAWLTVGVGFAALMGFTLWLAGFPKGSFQ